MGVEITLFGAFEVRADGETVDIRGQKARALLAWLAAHLGVSQPREKLAGMFWGDAGTANARTSLRQALAALRRVLPEEAFEADTAAVALRADTVTTDLARLRQLVTASPADLKQLAATYQGDFLEDLNPRSEAFEDWQLIEREQYRQLAARAFEGGIQTLEVAGEQDAVIHAATSLVALDPLNEAAHRSLMAAYARSGQASAALRHFERVEALLRRELNAPPSMATVALLRDIKDGELQPVASRSQPLEPALVEEDSDRRAALPSIAVLPFVSMSSDPEHGYLADGMTEELINLLAQSVNWRVTARNSSFRYKDQNVDVREVGQALGVAYIVEGSVRRVGNRIRVTAQLVSTVDGTHIWSDRYDRPLEEIFDVQDEVVHGIFRVLKNRIGFAERERVRRTQNANLDAWGLLIKANQVQVSGPESREQQRELVREALRIDPDYPRAHAFLASIMFTAVGRGYTDDAAGDYTQAQTHADAALGSGATDVVVLKMCAGGFAAVGKTEDGLRLAERAYELSGNPDPLLVAVLMWAGRIEEAYEHCSNIVGAMAPGVPAPPGELRPVALLGNLEMLRGNLKEALALAEADMRANPGNYFSHANFANVLAQLDRMEEAMQAWDKARELMPALTVRRFRRGYEFVFTDPALNDRFCAGLDKLEQHVSS